MVGVDGTADSSKLFPERKYIYHQCELIKALGTKRRQYFTRLYGNLKCADACTIVYQGYIQNGAYSPSNLTPNPFQFLKTLYTYH